MIEPILKEITEEKYNPNNDNPIKKVVIRLKEASLLGMVHLLGIPLLVNYLPHIIKFIN